MEETEYRDNEQVLYRTTVKLKLPHKTPEEVNCFVTEDHVLIEAEEPIKIPLSLIQDISVYAYPSDQAQEPSYGTATLTFLDDQNKKRKLSLETTAGSLAYFKETINETIRKQMAKPVVLFAFCWWLNNRDNPYLFRDTLLKLLKSENLSYERLTKPVV